MKRHIFRCMTVEMAVALLVIAQPRPQAHAAISGCTVDPVVTVSTGASIRLSAHFGAQMDDIAQIVWSLNLPRNVSVLSTALDGMVPGKEQLTITHNGTFHMYRESLLITSSLQNIAVTNTMAISPAAGSDGSAATTTLTGIDNQVNMLRLSF